MKAFCWMLALLPLWLQAEEKTLITERFDRFTKKATLFYQPKPEGKPWIVLAHDVGNDHVVASYFELTSSPKLRHGCTTEGLADDKPFRFEIDAQYSLEPMRSGVLESVGWMMSMSLLETFAKSKVIEIRHCGIELYVQPELTEGAAQLLKRIKASGVK